MAHKTLIGGTAYEIKGGKALIDGTAFSIKSGKTLVDGTAYEVGFAPSTANVKITTPDSGNASFPNIIINGVNYNNTEIEYELVVPIGTIVELAGTAIYINGVSTLLPDNTYTIMGDVEIQRSTVVIPPSGPPFTPTVKVGIYIIEL